MKVALYSMAAAGLLHLAAAQPAHRPNPDNQQHKHIQVQKRDAGVDTVTDIVTVTATTPDAVVWVDQNGKPVSTSFVHAATPAAQPASSATGGVAVPAPAPAQPSVAVPVPVAASPASSAAAGPASSSEARLSGQGIVYSPYNADGSCKTQAQVNADFGKINGYGTVRIYGVDCNQATTVLSAAKAKGMKVFAGIYDISQVASEMATLIAAVGNSWNSIAAVSIGNEVVNSQGAGMVPAVVAAIGTARTLLKATAYKGPVVTVDTFNAMIANPALCKASDFAAVNAHAFFDPTQTPATAGAWALRTQKSVAAACGGMKTVITESGWPSKGSCNGVACPSLPNQQQAVTSLKSSLPANLFVFSAYNDLWKQDNAGTFGCEKYWGILGNSS